MGQVGPDYASDDITTMMKFRYHCENSIPPGLDGTLSHLLKVRDALVIQEVFFHPNTYKQLIVNIFEFYSILTNDLKTTAFY